MGEWIIHPPAPNKRVKTRGEAGDWRVMGGSGDGSGRMWMTFFLPITRSIIHPLKYSSIHPLNNIYNKNIENKICFKFFTATYHLM